MLKVTISDSKNNAFKTIYKIIDKTEDFTFGKKYSKLIFARSLQKSAVVACVSFIQDYIKYSFSYLENEESIENKKKHKYVCKFLQALKKLENELNSITSNGVINSPISNKIRVSALKLHTKIKNIGCTPHDSGIMARHAYKSVLLTSAIVWDSHILFKKQKNLPAYQKIGVVMDNVGGVFGYKHIGVLNRKNNIVYDLTNRANTNNIELRYIPLKKFKESPKGDSKQITLEPTVLPQWDDETVKRVWELFYDAWRQGELTIKFDALPNSFYELNCEAFAELLLTGEIEMPQADTIEKNPFIKWLIRQYEHLQMSSG